MVNIAELLKESSYGLELYSTLFGVVYLKGVSDNTNIAVYDKNKISRYFNKYGQYFDNFPDAECQLFPAKGQSWDDWKHTVEFAKTSFDIHNKFKVGDWIISKDETKRVYQITDIKNGRYFYNNTSKYDYIKVADMSYDLWDMTNAKDGDILYSLDSKKPFIYKYREPHSQATAYCGINKFNEFFVWHTKKCIICTDKYVPATEEQCNWLFKEMENAGYTWDPDNKKLTKKTKFKIGDWIIRNDGSSIVPIQIYNLKKDRYLVTNMLGSKGEVMLTCQNEWRLWSINDAKPGDILNANGAVFIYKKHNKDYVYHYCGINLGYEFVIGTDDSIWNANNKIYPATQEQKDLLFNKIKEAGYTWDLNSNTLTKKTKFKIGDWVTDGTCKAKIIDIDNKYYWYSKNSMLGEIESIDKKYHIWSVEDVKPGDVIDYKGEISIYKHSIKNPNNKKDNVFGGFGYYCCYDGKRLWIDGFYALTEKDKPDIHPATEEQIETLFSYMTPAGYIWDFNNKALKKTKFKIGNWIVNNVDKSIGQITEIICDEKDPNTLYVYEHTNGFFTNDFEDFYHLWTIKDVKDGDILSAKIDGDDYILLFKQIKDGWIETYGHYYITIDKFCAPTQMFCRDYQGTLYPATQEQRNLLFNKMKDAGYCWNSNKNELYKINLKPKFKVGDWIVNKGNNDSPLQICNIKKDGYLITNISGLKGKLMLAKQDECRLWSIRDAKDGDVLCTYDDDKPKIVFIYKDGDRVLLYHCFHNMLYHLQSFVTDEQPGSLAPNGNVKPATKKQRDLLFQKMKEGGYVWDKEKKELKKLKSHPDYQELELSAKAKFKVGDWIIDKYQSSEVFNVSKVLDHTYEIIDKDGYNYHVPHYKAEEDYRFWTINDAKNGDVLVIEKTPINHESIFIFQKINENRVIHYCYYFNVNGEEVFGKRISNNFIGHMNQSFHPATKEQRNLLFQKMKEGGYEWDERKKELREINSHYDISNFQPFDYVLTRDGDMEYWNADFFSSYHDEFHCFRGSWEQCIPFNEDTKRLLGTTDMPDKKYINW